MKLRVIKVLSLIGFLFVGVSLINNPAAKAKTIKGPINIHACRSGRFLYYSYNAGGTRDGIIRLDTKTGKKKTIIQNSMADSSWTNGFRNLTIKGKYIYATWDKYSGTDGALNYIYRISKDGSSMKELACGCDMVLKGKRIYYSKCKYIDDGYGGYTEIVGKASMKLDGTDKRSEKGNKFSWKSSKCEIYDLYTKEIKEYRNGKYKYYPTADGKKLIRKSNSGNAKTVFKVTGKYRLYAIEVHGDMLLVQCDNNSNHKSRVYFVKNSGSEKRLLKEWVQAE